MHPTVMILLAVAVGALGYRFYGKFLKLGILQLHDEGSSAAPGRADDPDFEPRGRWAVSAVHAATSTGLLSLIGAAVAVVWGWVPAFLWVVVGGMVAATVLSVGTMWASLRRPGESLAGLAYEIGGLPAALALFFAGVMLLVLVGATLGMILGNLLHAHPETTWPFLSLMVVGGLLRGDPRTAALRIGAGLVLFAAAFAAGHYLPLSLGGSWIVSIRGVEMLSLRHELIWAGIALAIAYRAAHLRPSDGSHGRCMLGTLLAVLVLVLFTAGTALQGNTMDAPQFNNIEALPPAPVLIFLVLTGGALSGMHALIAAGATSRGLQRQRDIMPVGYTGVGLESLVAVMVIAALVTGFTGVESWQSVYGTWPTYGGLYIWVDLAITKIALAISATGVPLAWAVALVAAMAAALALAMLETGLRILSASVGELIDDFELQWVRSERFNQRAAVALTGLAAFALSQTQVNLQHWLLVGIANQWLACAVLLLLGLLLWQTRRPALLCWIPLAVIGPLTLWGSGWIMLQWLRQGDWALLGIGAVICATGLVYFAGCGNAALRLRRQTAPAAPRF